MQKLLLIYLKALKARDSKIYIELTKREREGLQEVFDEIVTQ